MASTLFDLRSGRTNLPTRFDIPQTQNTTRFSSVPTIQFGQGHHGDTIFSLTGAAGTRKLPREIRRNPLFRERFSLTENAPFRLGEAVTPSLERPEVQRASTRFTINIPPAPPAPDPITSVQLPGQTFRREGNALILEESESERAIRRQRDALKQEYLTELEQGVSEGRIAQFEKVSRTFADQLFHNTETLLRQKFLDQGKAGFTLERATVDLAQEVEKDALLVVNDLMNQEIANTRAAIGLLEEGGNLQDARAIRAAALGGEEIFARERLRTESSLAHSRLGLQADTARAGLAFNLTDLMTSAFVQREQFSQQLGFNAIQQRDQLAEARRNRNQQILGDVFGAVGLIGGPIAAGMFGAGRAVANNASILSKF